MIMLSCRRLTKSFGDKEVLKRVDIDIQQGDRIGLVGNNGSGKTTLANIIYGCLEADSGTIEIRNDSITMGYLRQSLTYTSYTLNGYAMGECSSSMGELLQKAGMSGLKGIGKWNDKRYAGLSSGEKTKLALSHILSTESNLLILDEPTNHMDYNGIEWLIKELSCFKGAILIISHDRYFLDRAASRIIELEQGILMHYYGNYTHYKEVKRKRYEEQLGLYNLQEKKKLEIQDEINRLKSWSYKAHSEARETARVNGTLKGGKEFYRAKAKKMDKQVKSKIKRLEKMNIEGVLRPIEEQKVLFNFCNSSKHGKRILEAKDITKRYEDLILFDHASFCILRGEKIGIFGENGCGKTTLLKGIIGQESFDSGELWLSSSISLGYLSQDIDRTNEDKCVLEKLNAVEGGRGCKARTILSNMGFTASMQQKTFGSLSMGEKMRVALAGLILDDKDMLIMDEPTNHLDISSREQLEATLREYTGTLIMVSHDRYLMEKVCDKILIFKKDSIIKMDVASYFSNLATRDNINCKDALSGGRPDESLMLIENRITQVLGELSNYWSDNPRYIELAEEFDELIRQKRELLS